MTGLLGGSVTADFFVSVLVCVILIALFVFDIWPKIKAAIKGQGKAEEDVKTVEGRLARLEKKSDKMNDMLSRDYTRLNTAEKLARANAKAINDSLEERRIIMVALLAALQGMKELGANGPVTEAVREINGYLNRQAHINQEVIHDAEAPLLNPNI